MGRDPMGLGDLLCVRGFVAPGVRGVLREEACATACSVCGALRVEVGGALWAADPAVLML